MKLSEANPLTKEAIYDVILENIEKKFEEIFKSYETEEVVRIKGVIGNFTKFLNRSIFE